MPIVLPAAISFTVVLTDVGGGQPIHRYACFILIVYRCQFSERLTACVHLLASGIREADKMARLDPNVPKPGRPTVQCTPDGLFKQIQCDVDAGWVKLW